MHVYALGHNKSMKLDAHDLYRQIGTKWANFFRMQFTCTTFWLAKPHWHVLLPTMLRHLQCFIQANLDQPVTKQANAI